MVSNVHPTNRHFQNLPVLIRQLDDPEETHVDFTLRHVQFDLRFSLSGGETGENQGLFYPEDCMRSALL